MAVRYDQKKKDEVVAFVENHNAKKGRGGQSAAVAKYGISPIMIAAWLKKAGSKSAGKKRRVVAKKKVARKKVAKKKIRRTVKAKAPVVAAAFHPSLAPVGVLLAVVGYALGTYGAYLSTLLMQLVARS